MNIDWKTAEKLLGPSRHHHGRRAFENRWGTEQELLLTVNNLL